jgi:Lrp/AsnC family transcriptional regulator, regulator for asnA, asnC and gidA
LIALDDLDCRIIELLLEDARLSSRSMTSRLGDVSDRVVRYRIKRLLDHRVVLLQALVNPRAVGYPIIADILIDVVAGKLAETCAKLVGMEAVASVSAAHTGRQLSIQVNARDERELMTFVRSDLPQLDGIVRAQTMVVPRLIKDLAFWKPPAVAALEQRRAAQQPRKTVNDRRQRARPSVAREVAALRRERQRSDADDFDLRRKIVTPLDGLDHQIVALLQEDPRMSSRDMIGRLGGVSDRVVRYRVKRLLDRYVILVQARVNPHKVGYPVVADTLIEVVPWKLGRACMKLAAMEPVCYMSAAAAGREVSIEVNARSEGELAAFVKGRLPEIDGIVRARTVVVPRRVKDVALWEIPR